MNATRALAFPRWKTVALDDESITVRFWAPGSKFGAVEITLARSDIAQMLLHADKSAPEDLPAFVCDVDESGGQA